MELSELKSLVGNGKIFSVIFTKRTDGTERRMVCRVGVSKSLVGRGPSYDAESKDLLTVYDMEKKAYRMIPAEGVIELRAMKQQFKFQSRTR
jgi:hypothetical protein